MKHIVITVGCEYGSGGPQIGRKIADSFGIEFYDRDLVDKVVEKMDLEQETVRKADEGNAVRLSFDTKFGPRYADLSNKIIYNQFEVIHRLAEQSSCVLIGRCSDYILQDRTDCLNLFIYAPKETRIKSVMEMENLSREEAEAKVSYYDENEHKRYKYMTGTYRGDRSNRHLLMDSSLLGWDLTAKYLIQLVELRFGD